MIDNINDFLNVIGEVPVELYNEAGLQHELAIFLRNNNPELQVKLEYPTSRIFENQPNFTKKEIDIYVTTQADEKFVIELKMPKNGAGTPAEMYSAIKDVKFLEELKENGIDGCYAILFTDITAFWHAPQANVGIYNFFNGNEIVIETLHIEQMPNFLQPNGPLILNDIYHGTWIEYKNIDNTDWKYYLIDV
jgi:hypothetical protein